MRFLPLCLLVLSCLQNQLSADDQAAEPPPENAAKAIFDHWLNVSQTYAKSLQLAPATPGSQPFALYDQPIFRHTQSVRGDDIGTMHVWTTADKRPAVVGVIFAWSSSKTTRMGSYEFHSLTSDSIQLKIKGKTVWTSGLPGFTWQSFPEPTSVPQARKVQQRLQARQLARSFTANTTAGDGQKWKLRFVPTPIYQYEAIEAGVAHGEMFAFCQGTDTEVILLIEAFTNDPKANPELAWRYALVPFTDYKARVHFRDKPLWESPDGQLSQDGKPHFWDLYGSIPKPDFEIKPPQ